MKLSIDSRLSKKNIVKEIVNKIKGFPKYLVDGRYRNNTPDIDYIKNSMLDDLDNQLGFKLNRDSFSMNIDEETNALSISFVGSVTNTLEEHKKFIDLLEELGYTAYVLYAYRN